GRVCRPDRRQPVLQNREDQTFGALQILKAVNGTRCDVDGAGSGKRSTFFPFQQLSLALQQHEDLKQSVVAMKRYLPIVQLAALRKGFAVQPEVSRFFYSLPV